MKYKAIFFDRDGTLTYFDKEKELWRDKIISQWSGKNTDKWSIQSLKQLIDFVEG